VWDAFEKARSIQVEKVLLGNSERAVDELSNLD